MLQSQIQTALEAARQRAPRLRPAALILARLLVGSTFLLAGAGKLGHLEATSQFFAGLGLPAPGFHALAIALLELIGGIALLFGLWTRGFALFLGATMVVALGTADRPALAQVLSGETSAFDVAPLPLLAFLLVLIAEGAERWSLDAVVAKRGAESERQGETAAAAVFGLEA